MRHLRQCLRDSYSDGYSQRDTDSYSHTYADSNSDVYPDCYGHSCGNDTAYAESNGEGYGHAKAHTDAEAASDTGAASRPHTIKTMVDVLEVDGVRQTIWSASNLSRTRFVRVTPPRA